MTAHISITPDCCRLGYWYTIEQGGDRPGIMPEDCYATRRAAARAGCAAARRRGFQRCVVEHEGKR